MLQLVLTSEESIDSIDEGSDIMNAPECIMMSRSALLGHARRPLSGPRLSNAPLVLNPPASKPWSAALCRKDERPNVVLSHGAPGLHIFQLSCGDVRDNLCAALCSGKAGGTGKDEDGREAER